MEKNACEDWKQRVLLPVLQHYKAEDVFNADDTGLYWSLLPDKTHSVAGETCSGGKKSKERVTILVCINMNGSERCPLLTIGKFKCPRYFTGICHLPTEYDTNKYAWMTPTTFEEWLQKWDLEVTQKKSRKIAPSIDN